MNVTGLVMRIDDAAFEQCLVMYDRTLDAIFALLETWSGDDRERLLGNLKALGDAVLVPTTLPLHVFYHKNLRLDSVNQDHFKRSVRICLTLDLEPSNVRSPDRMEDYSDLGKTTLELTKMAEAAAGLEMSFNEQQELVFTLEDFHKQYWNVLAKGDHVPERKALIHGEIEDGLRSLPTQIRYSRRRMRMQSAINQSLIQTVYSLTASRDNRLNFEAAEAARRDSSDMRVIAWVTMCFLPATFVAAKTFFSTNFFDWRAPTWQGRVSTCVWIYCVTSGGLTAVVLLLWRLTSTAVNKKRAGGLKIDEKPSGQSTLYENHGDQEHFRPGSHDLGGELVTPSWENAGEQGSRRAHSRSPSAAGDAESV
ncbi:hypothetical protein LTR37_015813 [Vermiconidia calcicola]|uniref:Uncharacterized protein n=1 Tax=Vermiconidia calcicola TaxID=1690605 RepID=A0ACC3MPQ0_9PEZI|nr:hypothetical protein LTR37_015813 [Vermiconidia calcicola]